MFKLFSRQTDKATQPIRNDREGEYTALVSYVEQLVGHGLQPYEENILIALATHGK